MGVAPTMPGRGRDPGRRIVLNRFFGYISLSARKLGWTRGVTLATYALCGFANFGSVAIQIGASGTHAVAPR